MGEWKVRVGRRWPLGWGICIQTCLVVAVVLSFVSSGWAVVVTTTGELETAVTQGETLIELNAPLFVLDSWLNIDHDCVFRPYSDRSGNGGVIIDGNDLYHVGFRNATITVGQNDPCNVLTFTRGNAPSVWVDSGGADTEVVFNYCQFLEANQANGLSSRSGAYRLAITCNYCQANCNNEDGFNMHNLGSDLAEHTLVLNHCVATGNDRLQSGGGCGDGATAHNPNQTIYIHGGTYHSNGKSGVAMVGGAKCYIDGHALFYNNGITRQLADVYTEGGGYLEITDAEFRNVNYPLTGYANVRTSGSPVTLFRCVFYSTLADEEKQSGMYVWKAGNGGEVTIENCIFTGAGFGQTAVRLESDTKALVKNCTFYDNQRHVDFRHGDGSLPNTKLVNNIFKDARLCAILCNDGHYSGDPNSGYNCFHGNLLLFYGETGGLHASDIEVDPLMIDAAGGDFHLRSSAGRWDPNAEIWVYDSLNSPCIDAGDPNSPWDAELWPHGGRISMGAYGNQPEASMSLSNTGNVADLNHDGTMDGADFSLFGSKWLSNEVLLPEDFDRNGIVNQADLAILAENWLWPQ